MLNKNNTFAGVFISCVFPLLALAVKHMLKNNLYIINKPLLPYFVAIGLNLILLRISFKNNLDKTSQGIMLGSFIILISILIFRI